MQYKASSWAQVLCPKGAVTKQLVTVPTRVTTVRYRRPVREELTVFYTKLHNRLLRPLLAAHDPPAPLPLRQALRVINQHVDDYVCQARIAAY